MFPHTITVFVFDEGTQSYAREVIEGVYWDSSLSQNQSGKARENSVRASIVIPKAKMENSIVRGSYIVKGEVGQINSMSELAQYDEKIQVTEVEFHDAGWDIDNMVVHGV